MVTSEVIEIEEVVLPKQDYSHVTVRWRSQSTNDFLEQVKIKFGRAEKQRLSEKLFTSMNATLQKREPLFRTALMREMFFRRVPRIFFEPIDLVTKRQSVLDEAMENFDRQNRAAGIVYDFETESQVDPTERVVTPNSNKI